MANPDPAEVTTAIDLGGPIEWRSLHETVVARLRDLIAEGQLPEGSRIIERELCDQLGVSRTPLREAFKVLASEGLVEILPNRGAVVTRLSPREAHDMLAVLARLEAFAGELACLHATDDELRGLRDLHERMMEYYRQREKLEYFRINQSIHVEIVRVARNEVLRSMHGRLHARMKRSRFRGNDIPDNWAAAVADHEELIVALETRNGRLAHDVLRRHIEASWTRLANSLAIDPASYD
ncbi:MAG: GntR family transcriptional regulator [Proteobacteria bacterium]|nr:GntR family transcriptional regulator [Pseudomonadota bacterium]